MGEQSQKKKACVGGTHDLKCYLKSYIILCYLLIEKRKKGKSQNVCALLTYLRQKGSSSSFLYVLVPGVINLVKNTEKRCCYLCTSKAFFE